MAVKDFTILITGGSGKLGRLFIEHFLTEGATVIYTSRSAETISALRQEISSRHIVERLHGICVNLESEDGVDQVLTQLEQTGFRPDCLVNNARNLAHLKLEKGPIPPRNSWWGEYLMDVVVPCELAMGLAEQVNSRLRTVINVASMYGVVAANPYLYTDHARESPMHYGIAKAAMIHLTKELAVRLAPRGIRVNAISYGGVEGRADAAFMERYAQLVPSGQMLAEADVVGSLAYLASEMSRGTTGHNLVVDGGWSIW